MANSVERSVDSYIKQSSQHLKAASGAAEKNKQSVKNIFNLQQNSMQVGSSIIQKHNALETQKHHSLNNSGQNLNIGGGKVMSTQGVQ